MLTVVSSEMPKIQSWLLRSADHHLQLPVSKDNLKRFCQMKSWIGQCLDVDWRRGSSWLQRYMGPITCILSAPHQCIDPLDGHFGRWDVGLSAGP